MLPTMYYRGGDEWRVKGQKRREKTLPKGGQLQLPPAYLKGGPLVILLWVLQLIGEKE